MARNSRAALPRPTDGELAILRVLWDGGPATVRRVHDKLGREIAYTTVLKLMQIMTEKGLVRRDEAERSHVYAADKVVVFTFMLGGSMAGIAGVFYAFVYKQVYFYMGFTPGIKAFGAAVLGGIGSIPAPCWVASSWALWQASAHRLFLDGWAFPAPYQLRDLIAFTLLIMVLIFRPRALLGEQMAKKRA